MRLIWTMSLTILAALAAFTGTALAATAASPDDGSLLDLAKPIFDAVTHGNYAVAAAAALVLGVALVRRYAGPRVPFLHSDAGGALLALFGSFGGAVATAGAAGASVTTGVLWLAFKIAVAAAGGYSLIKKLIVVPLLQPLAKRAPAWAQPIFALVFWVFDRPDPVAEAEKAGEAAVAAKPSTGAAGVLGTPTELE